MKKDIHPADYREVLFEDIASGAQFVVGSTLRTQEEGTFKGATYPKVIVEFLVLHILFTRAKTVL
jgi:ribosomal protein L31